MIEIRSDGTFIYDTPRWEKRVSVKETIFYKCPVCKVEQPHRSKFCPNCGVQLRGHNSEMNNGEVKICEKV